MLVLSRKAEESTIIDKRITVKILEIQGNRIRLGIEAPKEVPVMREELIVLAAAKSTAAWCLNALFANAAKTGVHFDRACKLSAVAKIFLTKYLTGLQERIE
jgi:carbon storage regulator